MASLWNMLREEVLGTVDDFRQKGAMGALRDAALDTKDMAMDAGGWLVDGLKGIVAADETEGNAGQAYVVGPDVPKRGTTVMLCLPHGEMVEATVVDVDGVSEPPRARVTAPGLAEPLLVPILKPAAATQDVGNAAAGGAADRATMGSARMSVLEGFKQELNSTIRDFREKGAVGAMKDAALDAVDMVGSTAKTAVSGARSLAEPCVQDFREKGAVGAVKDAALDAVDILGSTAKTAVSGAKSIATPLIDLVSEPQAATPQTGEEGAAAAEGSVAPASASVPGESAGTLLDGLKQEWNETVQDFREKGAVGAVKDAALDAVDMVGSTATTAIDAASTVVKGARARAAPLLEQVSGNLPDLWVAPSASASSAPAAAGPAEAAAPPSAAPAAQARPSSPAAATAAAAEPSSTAQKPVFAPPARAAASEESSGAAPALAQMPAASAGAVPDAFIGTPREVRQAVPESDMPGGKPGRRSLVSMRRNMFEKPKQEDAKPQEEGKKEAEELID